MMYKDLMYIINYVLSCVYGQNIIYDVQEIFKT